MSKGPGVTSQKQVAGSPLVQPEQPRGLQDPQPCWLLEQVPAVPGQVGRICQRQVPHWFLPTLSVPGPAPPPRSETTGARISTPGGLLWPQESWASAVLPPSLAPLHTALARGSYNCASGGGWSPRSVPRHSAAVTLIFPSLRPPISCPISCRLESFFSRPPEELLLSQEQ